MNIINELKKHLQKPKIIDRYAHQYESETGFGSPYTETNFDIDVLMKEIDAFCATFKETP